MKRVALVALVPLAMVAALSALDAVETPQRGKILPATDHILVDKSERRLTLFRNGRAFRGYDVALGRGGPGDKEREGDSRVPEGRYRIVGRNQDSAYHLSSGSAIRRRSRRCRHKRAASIPAATS